MPEITLFIADSSHHFRRSLRTLCEVNGKFTVVGEAANSSEAITRIRRLRPRVVLIDAQLGDLGGLETTRRILAENPDTKVLVLSLFVPEKLVVAAQQAGAWQCLAKDCDPATLFVAMIRAAHASQ